MPPDHEKRISPREAFRAIYFDFEGFKDQAPALLGWACEFDNEQIVLDPRLRLAAEAKGLPVMTLRDAVIFLQKRCTKEDRHLVAFSQAEKQSVASYTDLQLGERYRDAHLIAKRWANRLHPGTPTSWRLKDLLQFIGFPPPKHLGDGKATKKLKAVIDMLETKGDFASLTPTVKRHWTNLLTYNRYDYLGMRDLVMRAAAELALAREHGIVVSAGP